MKQGDLFTMQFCHDIPWVVASGGSKGALAVWDISESKAAESHFKSFLIPGSYKEEDYSVIPGDDESYESAGEMDQPESDGEKKKKKKKKDKKKSKKSKEE